MYKDKTGGKVPILTRLVFIFHSCCYSALLGNKATNQIENSKELLELIGVMSKIKVIGKVKIKLVSRLAFGVRHDLNTFMNKRIFLHKEGRRTNPMTSCKKAF